MNGLLIHERNVLENSLYIIVHNRLLEYYSILFVFSTICKYIRFRSHAKFRQV